VLRGGGSLGRLLVGTDAVYASGSGRLSFADPMQLSFSSVKPMRRVSCSLSIQTGHPCVCDQLDVMDRPLYYVTIRTDIMDFLVLLSKVSLRRNPDRLTRKPRYQPTRYVESLPELSRFEGSPSCFSHKTRDLFARGVAAKGDARTKYTNRRPDDVSKLGLPPAAEVSAFSDWRSSSG
jgi:hypothetical protein